MPIFAPPSRDLETELLALERRRCDAICANDVDTLDAMMSDGLVYVHLRGNIEDKEHYLKGLTDLREFKSVERENLSIRVRGDVVVMTGIQRVLVRRRGEEDFRELKVFATQVWARTGDGWQMEIYQSTGL